MKIISSLGIEIDTSVSSEDYEVEEAFEDIDEELADDAEEESSGDVDDIEIDYIIDDKDTGNAIDIGRVDGRKEPDLFTAIGNITKSITGEKNNAVPSGTYILKCDTDFEYHSRWAIKDENDDIVNVVDAPVFTLKRAHFNVYEGNMNQLVGRITNPLNLGIKDVFELEMYGNSCGKVKKHFKHKYVSYKCSDLNLEYRHTSKSAIYKDNQLIAEVRYRFMKGAEITYWDKSYKLEIIMIYFCFALGIYKYRDRSLI